MLTDPRIDACLSRWEECRRLGEPVDLAKLCRDCPDRLDAVRERIRQLQALDGLLGAVPDELTPDATEPNPPADAGRVAIVLDCELRGFHARGGMGEILIGYEAALDRELAIKRLQQPLGSDPDRRARFLREAAITSRLEHPGIVPIHGVNAGQEGPLCYAMRLVRGRTLAEAVACNGAPAVGATLRELLSRFVAVCNTVAYAHSRGVIHRDLKPSNVMLGPYGETIVLDWGLARRLDDREHLPPESVVQPDSEEALTRIGSTLGTPAFMSPEQAEGRAEALGPPSDVYSLGATLYVILTGRPPVTGRSIPEILDRVRRGDIPPPRTLEADVPRALEAVCLKALAMRPQDRYRSALDLAAEIEQWLADEPVAAYRDSLPVRLGRWGRRHRAGITAAAAVLIVAMMGLAVGAAVLGREQRQTARALVEARENFALAREAVDEYCTRVAKEQLLNEPGMEGLRAQLLRAAVAFYERFTSRHAGDPALRAELGLAEARLGSLVSTIESPAAGIPHYERAVALLAADLGPGPDPAEPTANDLARTRCELATAYQQAERYGDSETAYLAGLALAERLGERAPDRTDLRATRLYALQNLATLRSSTGREAEAERDFEAALVAAQRLDRDNPGNPKTLEALGAVHNNLAILHRRAGRAGPAETHYRAALAAKRRLVTAEPHDAGYRHTLAASELNFSILERSLGRRGPAAEHARAALAEMERLAREHPRVLRFRTGLGRAHNSIAMLHVDAADLAAAEASFRAAHSVLVPMAAEFPDLLEYVYDASQAASNVAEAAALRGDAADAIAWYDRAIAPIEALPRDKLEHPDARALLLSGHASRAEAAGRAGRFAEAERSWTRALALAPESARAAVRQQLERTRDRLFPADPFAR